MENNTSFGTKQTDSFNQVMEIGLNASAEILSKLLNNDVELNTQVLNQEKIMGLESFGEEPGLAVELEVAGAISGKVAVVVQNMYVKEILNVLMSVEDGEAGTDDELDEIAIGTFRELIGQTAVAFASSISNFLGSDVKIVTGQSEEISEECEEVAQYLGAELEDECYSLVTSFRIADVLSGSFVIALSEEALVNTIGRVMGSDDDYSDEYNEYDSENDYESMPNMGGAVAAARSSHATNVVKNGINVQSASFPSFAGAAGGVGAPLLNGNIDLLMDVPLNVTVEIGKTRRKMRDIMEFAQGTIIDLEKQAGAPVDVVVNGQLIARGDVVVIDDNFGVRITEIVGNANLFENN